MIPFTWEEIVRYNGEDTSNMIESRSTVVRGVGADMPTVVNEYGGKQSEIPYRVDLLPSLAILHISEILKKAAVKYGEQNWRKISITDNINHALVHLFAHLAGDNSDDHIGHAATRALFALELILTKNEIRKKNDTF